MLGLVLLVYRIEEGESMRFEEKGEPVYFLQLVQWQATICIDNNDILVSTLYGY